MRLGIRTGITLTPRRPKTSFRVKASYDAVVVGVGAMGSAALYHAAQSHLKVLGLEQFEVGHGLGSSGGHTRIYRVAHRVAEPYTPFALRAGKLWEDLEEDSGQHLLHRCGVLNVGQFSNEVASVMKEMNIEHSTMSTETMQQTYPGIQAEDMSLPVLLDPLGGILESDKIVQTHVRLAKAMNAEVHEGEKMIKWSPDGSGVRVETERGTYYAQVLILAAGPWMLQHIPQLKEACHVERQVIGWYDSRPSHLYTSDRFPAFLGNDGTDDWYFGVPDHERKGMKIAMFNHLREKVHPSSVNREVNGEDVSVMQRTLRFMFDPENHLLRESSVCLFTNAPDGHFILDKHPVHPQVLVCSPCSGTGFKFSGAIGQILIKMTVDDIDQETKQLLQHFSLDRPSLKAMAPFDG